MMSNKSRSIVFATFISSCLVVGLLAASLTTDYWIYADKIPHAARYSNGQGQVHFGLISGMISLKNAYGWSNETIIVPTLTQDVMKTKNFLLWVGTALGTGFGLFCCVVAALSAVIKSVSKSDSKSDSADAEPKKAVCVLLFGSSFAAAISTMSALILWLVEFYNDLTRKLEETFLDQQQYIVGSTTIYWYAWLGHSYYYVVVGCIIASINVILIIIVNKLERRDKRIDSPCDEETEA